jgi:hypothetical protein
MIMTLTCDELLDRLKQIGDMLVQLGQPGVRSVRDTDGSEVQYSQASLDALRSERARLEAIYNTCCGGRSRPFGFIF